MCKLFLEDLYTNHNVAACVLCMYVLSYLANVSTSFHSYTWDSKLATLNFNVEMNAEHEEEQPTKVAFKRKSMLPKGLLGFWHAYLLPIANTEQYRKVYFCPIKSCRSTRTIKKLTNHLTDVHGIRDLKERKRLANKGSTGMPAGQIKVMSSIKCLQF